MLQTYSEKEIEIIITNRDAKTLFNDSVLQKVSQCRYAAKMAAVKLVPESKEEFTPRLR